MQGKLFGIGVGPGDPELLTLKAIKKIQNCDVIAGQKSALGIVEQYIAGKELLECRFAMKREMAERKKSRQIVADQIINLLQQGKDVGFVTLGDASTYSAYTYVHELIVNQGYTAEVIPGITSYAATAAAFGIALCEDDEPLIIIPAKHNVDIDKLLETPGNKVLMKSGNNLRSVIAKLKEKNSEIKIGAQVTMAGEKLFENIAEYEDSPETGYFTIGIVKEIANG